MDAPTLPRAFARNLLRGSEVGSWILWFELHHTDAMEPLPCLQKKVKDGSERRWGSETNRVVANRPHRLKFDIVAIVALTHNRQGGFSQC